MLYPLLFKYFISNLASFFLVEPRKSIEDQGCFFNPFSIVSQSGATLIEVLVSMIILSFSILGFVGTSLQGMNLVQLAHQKEEAMRLVTELSERIASNPKAFQDYVSLLNDKKSPKAQGLIHGGCSDGAMSVGLGGCSPSQRALNDIQTLRIKSAAGFPAGRFGLGVCGGGSPIRYCIVFAWYDTSIAQCLEGHKDINTSKGEKSTWCTYLPALGVL